MSQDWISSKYGAQVYGLVRSDHPAWVWSAGSDACLWRNQAARWFHPRHKNGAARPAKHTNPIKGQIKRLLRLGFEGVPSLARVQMLVDEHPVSQTCRCTPIVLADGESALLCVSADTVAVEDFDRSVTDRPAVDRLLVHLGAYALVNEDNRVWSGSASGIAAAQDGRWEDAQRTALDDDLFLLIFSGSDENKSAEIVAPKPDQPPPPVSEDAEQTDEAEPAPAPVGRLTDLMERFDTSSNLYQPLGPEDDVLPEALIPVGPETESVDYEMLPDQPYGPDDTQFDPEDVAELEALDGDDPDTSDEAFADFDGGKQTEPVMPEPALQWRVTGRGFVPDHAEGTPDAADGQHTPDDVESVSSPETASDDVPQAADLPADEEMDQEARYNFDELARILTDRVAVETPDHTVSGQSNLVERRSETRTLSLSDEHLVLNRLPLGILVFRDQDIVFANRAMADLLACASIAELRERGLDAIFPRVDEPDVNPGPVATLLDSHGTSVPVSARLQAITWHGGPALMLSARREDTSPSGEIMVRNFVETLAASRDDGFVEISRSGVVETASGRAAELMGRSTETLVGSPLALFVASEGIAGLREFLEKPARRAGIDRPNLDLETTSGAKLTLFTAGNAGIVSGYFGLVADSGVSSKPPLADRAVHTDRDGTLMARMSRGLRRPLNTIIGFSQLLENQAFGPLGHARYLEYSRDIRSAGRDIEGLIDELDQYSGLQSETFLADASDFALDELLSECEGVVRHQASRRQVLVRSAISEHLPFIRADRTLLRQALLNLLASAIDQTPQGGKVILSAQLDDHGAVEVHVRDSGKGQAELSERFAVFREGSARAGEAMVPMKSSIGLALTRSLLAVNSCKLTIDPSSGTGTVMSLQIPADRTRVQHRQAD